MPHLPETVSPQFALWSIPPDPMMPAEMHGVKVVIVAGLYAGAPGRRLVRYWPRWHSSARR